MFGHAVVCCVCYIFYSYQYSNNGITIGSKIQGRSDTIQDTLLYLALHGKIDIPDLLSNILHVQGYLLSSVPCPSCWYPRFATRWPTGKDFASQLAGDVALSTACAAGSWQQCYRPHCLEYRLRRWVVAVVLQATLPWAPHPPLGRGNSVAGDIALSTASAAGSWQ